MRIIDKIIWLIENYYKEQRKKEILVGIALFVKNAMEETGDKELADVILDKANSEKALLLDKSKSEVISYLRAFGKEQEEILKKNRVREIKQKWSQLAEKIKIVDESKKYLIFSSKKQLLEEINEFSKFINKFRAIKDEEFRKSLANTTAFIERNKSFLDDYNEEFVEKRIIDYADFFKKSKVELDDEQKKAIVIDDKHNLVVAGAGSGKTEVLTSKIAYLIKRKPDAINPNKILALAFQRKAANEIKKRLNERYGLDVEIRTFHSLGNKLLKEAGKKLKIKFKGDGNFSTKYSKFIRYLFENELAQPDFQNEVINYIKEFSNQEKERDEADFKTKQEYYNYMRSLEYTALDGTKVKSEAEKEIMNFFLTHKINDFKISILYEEPAKWMVYSNKEGVEHIPSPDFFLKDYNIYIENWALNKSNKVPPWFETSSEKYALTKKIKIQTFQKQNKYSLVEMFSYEFNNKQEFNELLKERVLREIKKTDPNKNFILEKMNYRDLVESVYEFKEVSRTIPRDIASFIMIAKTYNLGPERIKQRLSSKQWSQKQLDFAEIALQIYLKYQNDLTQNEELDFCDMINLSIKELQNKKDFYSKKFDYILIDEYQDISKQRFELIKELMQKNPDCKLFCVGDDWQSIMAFTGANLDYFVRFGDYFDHPSRTDLSINYRSIKSIVDVGAEIIKQNGNAQIQKNTIARNITEKEIFVYSSLHKNEYKYRKNYYGQMADHCLELASKYSPEEVMILSRIKPRGSMLTMALEEAAKKRGINLSNSSKKQKQIKFMSVHKSKGLESKAVFILDVMQDRYGFPCELQNPDVWEPAIDANPINKEQEERRLFYVAVTRAKEDLFIYTMDCAKSKFLLEISKQLKFEKVPYNIKNEQTKLNQSM